MLLILDGWGHRDDPTDNALAQATLPNWDALEASEAHTLIHTEGRHVGLPDGQMGNSEVGHMNLGAGRMGEYLSRFTYGNADTRSGGEYWNGGSLEISPSEQMHFLSRLFRNELPASRQAMTEVQSMLGPPPEVMVGRNGVAVVRVPRIGDTSVIGKSASLVVGNEAISWQVGQIDRGSRRFVFVSCVTGPRSLPRNAAAVLAAAELRNGGAL
ncbi:penicillin-binding transpeptidase domain-containing protein [Lysobacter sp. 2RAB21]